MINTINIELYNNSGANLQVEATAYLYQAPGNNAANTNLKNVVYTYQTSDKHGNQINNLTSKVNPFIKLTYILPLDQNGNRQKADWVNVQYLTYNHIQDMTATLNQLMSMLNDPEAFVIAEDGTYIVSEKYLNEVVGFSDKDGNPVMSGRLHAVGYTYKEYNTNIEHTVSAPGVALILKCGGGHANILTLGEFKTLYSVLTSVNLTDLAAQFTTLKYLESLFGAKATNNSNYGYGSTTVQTNRNVGQPPVNTTSVPYGRQAQGGYGSRQSNVSSAAAMQPNYNNNANNVNPATVRSPYQQPAQNTQPQPVQQPQQAPQFAYNSGAQQNQMPARQSQPVQQQPVNVETDMNQNYDVIVDSLDDLEIPDYN